MKIFGLTYDKASCTNSELFGAYVISLFQEKNVAIFKSTQIIDYLSQKENESFNAFTNNAKLMIIAIEEEETSFERITEWNNLWRQKIGSTLFERKDIFLVTYSYKAEISKVIFDKVNHAITEAGEKILASFHLPNFESNFDQKLGIKDAPLYVELIRKVNGLKNGKFRMHYPDDKFTCGINPDRKFIGEVDGY